VLVLLQFLLMAGWLILLLLLLLLLLSLVLVVEWMLAVGRWVQPNGSRFLYTNPGWCSDWDRAHR
jgi:hypothetical protein